MVPFQHVPGRVPVFDIDGQRLGAELGLRCEEHLARPGVLSRELITLKTICIVYLHNVSNSCHDRKPHPGFL